MAGPESTDRLIAVGSSAGGIEALSTLVASIGAPFPAAIVVAQHLDPKRPSHLAAILARRSQLPVVIVSERTTLQSGVIYVAPADRHVIIVDHDVSTRRSGRIGPKPSVDLLLKSAAKAFGDRCVAVILTGSGSDGTAGAVAVKAVGGLVVIQNPDTASFPSMPRSLPPSAVDVVSELSEIGAILTRIVHEERHFDTVDDDDLGRLLDQLRATNGVDFNAYKRPTILRRLQSRLTATGQRTIGEYARFIEANPAEAQRLASSFLIKVTAFFRDPKVFAHLRDAVLPDLLEAARLSGELRIWSAGCATGEEAYSLAILVSEALASERKPVEVRIFATDVDEAALAFARRGVYSRAALKGLSAAQRTRYFVETDGECEVVNAIRRMVVFGQHDLGARAPFPRIDLILCRNVLIYFTAELQEQALTVFANSLRAGGRLVLGKSESVGPLADDFIIEGAHLKVFRRGGDRPAAIRAQAMPQRPLGPRTATGFERAIAQTRKERERRSLSIAHADWVIQELPIGVVVVDAKYKTLRINVAARELLSIHGPALDDDFVHLAEVLPATELRAAIKAAVDGRTTTAVYDVTGPELSTVRVRQAELVVTPHRASEDGPIDGALLVITDHSQAVADQQAVAVLTNSVDEAGKQYRRFLEANRELTLANDRLRVANDDFLFTAEEAQSGREEMETLAEELQATNEEFETLNEELQATNEQLTTANDDLAARSTELGEQRAELAAAHDRLMSVLDGMSDALLVVDRDGHTVITNKTYDAMFPGPDSEAVLEDETGAALPEDADPRMRARDGTPFTTEFSISGAPDGGADDRRWFEASGQGLRIADELWAGVVVIRDITDRSVRRLEEDFLARASHELRTPLAALHGYVQLLVRKLEVTGGGDPKLGEYAMSALVQTRSLGGLIDRLFDLSGLTAGRFEIEPQSVDLVALVQRVGEVARVLQVGTRLTVHAGPKPIVVEADAGRIEQVLLGLFTNSIEHGAATEINVWVRQTGTRPEVTVVDNGSGIAEADQQLLFDRLARVGAGHRRSRPGLGLGLYLAREIMTAHGGTIELQSAEGEGTTVTIRFRPTAQGRRR